ncbi:MAG TPA: hypothetical protein VI382_09085 [Candidatus Manganitrophaceae bacterium]|nr:hypothetical protein [Candidatus Manganitrophaceae bacterium]
MILSSPIIWKERVEAEEVEIIPSLSLRGTYDDHLITAEGRANDIGAGATGALSMIAGGPRSRTEFRYQLSGDRYFLRRGLSSRMDHRISLSNQIDWNTRWTTTLSDQLALSPDTTRLYGAERVAQVGEALVPLRNTVQNIAGLVFKYEASPRLRLEGGVSRSDTRYQDRALFDATTHTVSLSPTEEINPTDSIGASYRFSRNRVEGRKDVETHVAHAIYSVLFWPTFSATINGGASYTTEDHRFRGDYGGTVVQTLERGSLSFSANRGLGAGGGLFNSGATRDTFSFQWVRPMGERVEGRLQGAYSQNRSIGGGGLETKTYTAVGSLQYEIDAHWRGSATYDRLNQRTDGALEQNFRANRVSLVLTWQGTPWRASE